MSRPSNSGRRFRTLRGQAFLRIILPLILIWAGLSAAWVISFNRLITELILEHQHQVASLAAVSVAEILHGQAQVLAVWANDAVDQLLNQKLLDPQEMSALEQTFEAGVLFLNDQGVPQSHSAGIQPGWMPESSLSAVHESLRTQASSPFITKSLQAEKGDWYILIGVPVLDSEGNFSGSIIGATSLSSNSANSFVQNLAIGADGFSYLVDGQGTVLAHRDASLAGADFSTYAPVISALSGESGALIIDQASGERNIDSFAPIQGTDWSLVVQESWDSVIQPVQVFELVFTGIGVLLILVIIALTWRGIESIARPVRTLHDQVQDVARGETVELAADSGIEEIDALEHSFIEMNQQISAYRIGLRRYLSVVTGSLEEERRRIGRELHDETIQDLLAIGRRLEIFMSTEDDTERREKIASLQMMVEDTLLGLMQINRDLRPLLLEDLGLVPALQALVRAARKGVGAVPHARLETSGQPIPLNPDVELALYRITQESLTNIRKHAHATGIVVSLLNDSHAIRLEVSDDGSGFITPPSLTDFSQQGRFGLLGIQERVWSVGGSFAITSSPGMGTKLAIQIPHVIAPRDSHW